MPNESAKEYAQQYGYQLSFLKEDPSLWSLFQKAKKQKWTAEKWQAELIESKWFRQHSDTYRQNLEQRNSDPGTWATRLEETRAALADAAAGMGAEVSPKTLNKMASNALLYGWSTEQIRNKLAGFVDTVKGTVHYGGEAADTEATLRQMGMDYGQKIGDNTLKKWVRQIARGNQTVNDFKAIMQDQAEAAYPAYSGQIRKGFSMKDIADPYIQQMAATLELNTSNIDIFSKPIQDALKNSRADEKGGSKEFSMYDFEVELRKDPRWARTKGAQDQAMQITKQVMSDWGFSE